MGECWGGGKEAGEEGRRAECTPTEGRRALSTQELLQCERLTLTYPLGFYLDSSI